VSHRKIVDKNRRNPLNRGDLPLREGSFRQTGRNPDIRLGSCEGIADPWPTRRCSRSGAGKGGSPIDDRGPCPPAGHLWRAATPFGVHPGRLFAKGHLWALGTAGFARARALSPKCCELPRASLPGPGQSGFGRIDISAVKGALRSMHWNVDHCPVAMQFQKPAAVDGP
jgi:hypothetical protein